PVEDVPGAHDGFRVNDGPRTQRDVTTGGARRGADRAVEQRGPEAVEEPAVEAAALELAHGAGVTVGQDRLRPVGRCREFGEAVGDRVERLVPADALELAGSLGPDALH